MKIIKVFGSKSKYFFFVNNRNKYRNSLTEKFNYCIITPEYGVFMTKRRSRNLFILTAILLALCVVLTFVSFSLPFKINGVNYNYVSFADKLKTSVSLENGTYLEYRAELPEGSDEDQKDEYMADTIEKLTDILIINRYYDSKVFSVGDDIIRLEVSTGKDYQERRSLLSLIGSTYLLEFKTDTSSDDSFATGRDIASVKTLDNTNGYFGIQIQFNADKYEALRSASAGGNIYLVFGEQTVSYQSQSEITNGVLQLYSESFTTRDDANNFATMVKIGMLPLNLTVDASGPITSNNGVGAMLGIVLASLVVLLTYAVLTAIKTKQFALLTLLDSVAFVCSYIFILQSIPFMYLNVAGLVGMGVMFAFMLACHNLVYSYSKNLYNDGKLFHTSFKMAQKQALPFILTSSIMLCVTGGIFSLMPSYLCKSFGYALLVGAPINMIISLLMLRGMIKLYTIQNFDNPKAVNFKNKEMRDENI